MRVLQVRNVNDAWYHGVRTLMSGGDREQSRVGEVIVYPEPVTTVYQRPEERVLFCEARRANPFFHLFESMWMLSGQSDARWLDTFVSDFSARFAEDSGYMHGAYGHRWRQQFLVRDADGRHTRDQLRAISSLLRRDPTTRQAVLEMWSPERDLNVTVRDKPCNTHAYFRPRSVQGHLVLDMTILCRSNDIVWGAYGANAVHFSVLHEYMAAMSGMQQGMMWQVSNNWHAYVGVIEEILGRGEWRPSKLYEDFRVAASQLFPQATVGDVYDELDDWMTAANTYSSPRNGQLFDDLLVPMHRAWLYHRQHLYEAAQAAMDGVRHSDWQMAGQQWLARAERRHRDRSERGDGPEDGGAGQEIPHVAGAASAVAGGASVAGVETGASDPSIGQPGPPDGSPDA
jgi:thymidylate synthase